ncbi:MAG TPA: c-type cytochrome [Thermoanaerobaculia bacterium]|jgi:mono/diheme cytochrome c family protein|nr:c-type cytochrome [Thermoanaerobaculia bacterium]
MKKRQRITVILTVLVALAVTATLTATAANRTATRNAEASQATAKARVARGEYLVGIGGCNDCHTPLKMGPKGPEPDFSRRLSGHPEALKMPTPPKLGNSPWGWSGAITSTAFAGPWGVSYAANLTPDRITGIGIWNEEVFMKTLRTGRHWGVSRPILPPMPWQNVAGLTDDDLKAVYAYLRSIKPIRNQVPDAIVAPPPPAAGK